MLHHQREHLRFRQQLFQLETLRFDGLPEEHREIPMQRNVKRGLERVDHLRRGELNGRHPLPQSRQTVSNDVLREFPGRRILDVRHESPHGTGAGLKFTREARVISVWLEFDVRAGNPHVEIHPLEHFEEVEPHG